MNRTNKKVDKYNGNVLVIGNERYRKVFRFSRNEFLENIVCLISDHTFGLGGSRMWKKEEDINIIENKRKRRSSPIKVDLYKVCPLAIIYCPLFYFMNILIPFIFAIFMVSLSLRERISESISQNYFTQKRTSKWINGGVKSFQLMFSIQNEIILLPGL